MLNQVTLIGNAGKDAESRMTPNGKLVASFSLALNEGKDKPPLWVRVSAWEKLAEIVVQYVTKGKQVAVVGRLSQPNAYITKDGKPAASYEITAEKIQLLGGREDSGASANTPPANATPAPQVQVEAADIPF
jgi:single-strand DNA-binding protein